MAFGKRKKNKIFSEINITPLTDIFLVLLIIMMVIAPSFQSMDNNVVDVPEVNNGVNIEDSKVTISVVADGNIYVNGDPVQASALTDKLIAIKPDGETPEVVVKADRRIKSSKIMDIMDAAQNAEYAKLVVAGEPLSKKEQRTLKKESKKDIKVPQDGEG